MRPLLAALALLVAVAPASAQEARRRWEMQRQIRLDKFEQVLPQAMRANGIDMWIVAVKENHIDPLWEDLGRGYVSGLGYYVFTDRGADRIERAALGPSGYMVEESGAYDIFAAASTLPVFVKERNPRKIGVNISDEIGPADGLSHTMYQHLVKTLGEPYASRLVSAERIVSDFRSRRVASEIVAFGEAAGIAIQLTERALSNEVIAVGKTTLGGRRLVAAGSAARPCPRLGVRHAVGLRDRTGRDRCDLIVADHPAGRRDDDRLGRAVDELRHRRQARGLRAEAG
jgi:hypothetical protein